MYALVDETGRHDLAQLRSLQDWHLRYWLASVPGVAEVASIGGFVKQYQVTLDPNRLYAYGLSSKDVVDAIRRATTRSRAGCSSSPAASTWCAAAATSPRSADIEQVAVGVSPRGTPIRVADVASVRHRARHPPGIAELDGRGEVVGGIVVMRFGENALDVIDRVKARIEEIRPALPEGVELVTTYDRSGLIRESIGTLRTTLIEEGIVVCLVTLLFLFHIRSALIPIITLPIAVVATFIPCTTSGSLQHHVARRDRAGDRRAGGRLARDGRERPPPADRAGADGTPPPTTTRRPRAGHRRRRAQVGRPLFFSLLIIIVSFTPVFLLEAQEGRMFLPLAMTKTFAMAFGHAAVDHAGAGADDPLPAAGRMIPESRTRRRGLRRVYRPC
jgi:copper/silver efflux system protein